jgi:three-Cys-motif partner protein
MVERRRKEHTLSDDDGSGASPESATAGFFASKRAAAILKHAVLTKYVVPFASKTGSASPGHRVVIVDGYAGAGRYEDGQPGSPKLLADAATSPVLANRKVECYFVEQKKSTFDQLVQVLTEQDDRLTFEALHGSIEDHLDDLLDRAAGVPLFLFLDPFGLGLSFEVIRSVFERRPTVRPATEILLRFDAGAIWRIRGVLHSDKDYPGREAQLARLDDAAGGSWWRDEDDPGLDTAQYLDWFMTEFLSQVCEAAACFGWFTDVCQKEGVTPSYFLVFLTRHNDGMEVFGEALSSGLAAWRRAGFDLALGDQHGVMFEVDADDEFKAQESALDVRWHDRIERNLRGLVASEETFIVRDEIEHVFEGILGQARAKHVRVALKRLHADGTTSSDSKGDIYGKRVQRAT